MLVVNFELSPWSKSWWQFLLELMLISRVSMQRLTMTTPVITRYRETRLDTHTTQPMIHLADQSHESSLLLLFHLINNRYTCYQHHFCTKFLLHTSCLMNLKVPHNVMTVWRVVFSFRLIFILSIHFSIILVSVTSCCLSRWTKKNVTLIGPPTQIIWGKCSIIWWHQRNYRM